MSLSINAPDLMNKKSAGRPENSSLPLVLGGGGRAVRRRGHAGGRDDGESLQVKTLMPESTGVLDN